MTDVQFTPVAAADLQEILDHYLTESGVPLAKKFENSWECALATIKSQPRVGSPRLAAALKEPDLRIWPVRGFPYLIFYLDRPAGTVVIRVLHTARDIPGSLRD